MNKKSNNRNIDINPKDIYEEKAKLKNKTLSAPAAKVLFPILGEPKIRILFDRKDVEILCLDNFFRSNVSAI